MAQFDSSYSRPTTSTRVGGDVDAGLRTYMLGVYNYMAAGVALTGIVAYLLYSLAVTTDPGAAAATLKNGMGLTSFGVLLYTSPLKWVLMLAPLAFVFFFAYKANSMSVRRRRPRSGSTQPSSARRSRSSAGVHGRFDRARVLHLGGHVRKPQRLGLHDQARSQRLGIVPVHGHDRHHHRRRWSTSSCSRARCSSRSRCIGVLVFAGFTAYDTQRIKDDYYAVAGDATMAAKASIFGALSLYHDFVGLFMNLLTLLGDRE